jgi:hypothetical protein
MVYLNTIHIHRQDHKNAQRAMNESKHLGEILEVSCAPQRSLKIGCTGGMEKWRLALPKKQIYPSHLPDSVGSLGGLRHVTVDRVRRMDIVERVLCMTIEREQRGAVIYGHGVKLRILSNIHTRFQRYIFDRRK